jgi:two-component system cell cycle sensor histidine kinase/response regulator CckA
VHESNGKALILNVDDDEAGRYAVTRELRRGGFEVVEAAAGLAALEWLREGRPDLVLLDVHMPDIDGFEVCRCIRQHPDTSALPVLMLSASYLDCKSKVMALDGGADAYLTEPVEPPVLMATIRALLRLRRAEQRVRDSAREWAATFKAIQDGVAVLDQKGAILRSNDAFQRIVGPNGHVFAPAAYGLFQRLIGAADRPSTELVLGSKVLTITMDPVLSESAEISGVVCIVADVTEKRRFEEQLQHTQKLESIGVLAGGIAHDFNNLLTGILGNAGLLLNDLAPGSPERELAGRILRASETAAALTRQLLAYSGRGLLVTEKVDLTAVLRESQNLVRPFILNGAQLIYDLAEDLPAVVGDPGQIQQVIMNLIINAAESFKGKPGEVRLTTSQQHLDSSFFRSGDPEVEPGLFACIRVIDNGSGMDQETQRKIFDPFFTTKFTGRGLGLAAVHGILRGHRGLLRLVSQPGVGTTFELYFRAA